MDLYPLLMTPCYLHGDATPWGGHALRELFMKDAPETVTGASLEVCAREDCASLVSNGFHAAKSLYRMAGLWGSELTDGAFPLTATLLDIRDAAAGFECAGPAAWVILNAEPGAKLNGLPARPGDVFYIPAGVACAPEGEMQCYELRGVKTSERAEGAPVKNEGTTVLCKGGSRTYYVSDGDIELCCLNVSGRMPLEDERMLLLTAMGGCELVWGDERLFLDPFQTVVIPAALGDVAVVGDTKALMAAVSNRPALTKELGYRAENVAGLTE
jgi:mannose-6-phosphate isomerase